MYVALLSYLQKNSGDFAMSILQHVKISGISVLVAVIVGGFLGILASKSERIYGLITGFFGILRVIPSLAILVVCMPFLGVGEFPSVFALTVLAIPPVLINTAIAFRTLPESVLEAAEGMGMEKAFLFFKVKLPLAMPLILTGIRTASVEVIASATLAAYVGAGGLGKIILTGLGLYRMDLLLLGGITVAALSLLTDMIFLSVERHMTRYQRS